MKTTLPTEILTVKDAEKFLSELIKNKEEFHPEDDANYIILTRSEKQAFTKEEGDQLNKLMEDIYALYYLEDFDPCEYILENSDWNK